ncbi:MAG: PASTA domain-containing protein [Acidobacteriota bacterium]
MWRKLLRGVGCLAYAALLGALFVMVAYVAFGLFVRGGVTAAPDLVGLSQERALAMLRDQGLDARWTAGERFAEDVPRGHVMVQDPSPGVYVKRDTAVTLTVSLGPRRIDVPDLQGAALQAAQVELAGAGLALGRTFDVYATSGQPAGVVVRQHPPAGERVAVDAPVDLFLAVDQVADVFLMPDLVQRDYDSVRRFFERHGFRLGRVGYQSYDGVASGTVLRQFPLAGHPLRRGDVIALDVVAPVEPDAWAAEPISQASNVL